MGSFGVFMTCSKLYSLYLIAICKHFKQKKMIYAGTIHIKENSQQNTTSILSPGYIS